MTEITLGSTVRDKITGFTGVVVGLHKWINGCTTLTVQPPTIDKDGQPMKRESFDEPQCELVNPSPPVKEKKSGGPKDHPTRQLAP